MRAHVSRPYRASPSPSLSHVEEFEVCFSSSEINERLRYGRPTVKWLNAGQRDENFAVHQHWVRGGRRLLSPRVRDRTLLFRHFGAVFQHHGIGRRSLGFAQ